MPDLARTVRGLARRVAGLPSSDEPDPGTAGVAGGGRAVAVAEALIADAAALDGTAAGSASRAETATGGGNLLGGPLRAQGAPGARAALSAAIGMALGGLRATAFLDGPDLEANLDLVADAAERRLPLVVHVTARAGRRSAGGGHRGWHAATVTGAVQLFAASVQEAVDLTFVARRVAEEALVPVLVGMDVETAEGVEDLRIPSAATLRAYLGSPDDTVHAASPSQERLLGRHRRRLPRWHDLSHPRTGGALAGREHLAAQAARRAYLDGDAAAALLGAFAAWTKLTGRGPAPFVRHGAAGARVVLVAEGALTATAAAVTAAGGRGLVGELLGGSRRAGVVGLTALRPLPAAEMALALDGAELVIVLERSDAPLDDEGPLTREVRGVVARMPASRRPDLATVVHALGGAPLRAADLAELCRRAGSAPRELLGAVRYLGVDLAPGAGAWPKRQVVLDALRRDFPRAASLGVVGRGGAPELRPAGAWTVAFQRRGDAERELMGEAAALLHRLAGGHLRGRAASGPESWGSAAADRLSWAPEPFADPGDDAALELAVWTHAGTPPDASAVAGLAAGAALLVERPETGWQRPPAPEVVRAAVAGRVSLYSLPAAGPEPGDGRGPARDEAAGLRRERLLGALLAVLAATGRLEVKARQLLAARRELLAGRGLDGEEVERRIAALQAGFDTTHPVAKSELEALPPARPQEDGVPAALRRAAAAHDPGTVESLARFRDQVVVPGADDLLPDPHLASGVLPAGSAALASTAAARTMLPAFEAAACTGCGDCWTACPDGAVGPVVLGAAALLDRAMARAAAGGASVDALRRVAGKIAGNVHRELKDRDAADGADLFAAAFAATLAKTKLPDDRLAAVRAAFAAVQPELAGLPVARTEAFFDAAETASSGSGQLFSLAIDPDACKGCGLCVAACEPAALTAAADAPRRTREARALWRRAGELPPPSPQTLVAAAERVGPLAAAMLDPAARGVLAGAAGSEAGSGESLAARQLLAAAAAALAPRRAELLRRLEAAAGELAEAIQSGLARALPARDLDALSRGLAGLDRPEAELAELAARVETAFEAERVDVPRLRHLVDAARELADLRWHLEHGEAAGGRALFSVVAGPGRAAAWAGTFPSAPFTVPVTVCAGGDAAALARGVLAGQTAQALDGLRVLRRARVELDAVSGPAGEQRVEAELARLARLGWQDLDAEERALVPPLFLLASEDALLESSLPGLLALLAGDPPVKVLLLAEAHLGIEETWGAAERHSGGAFPSLDAGWLALLPPRAFAAQSSIAFGDHLQGAVAAALANDGPALLRVHAPSPSRHGFAADATLVRAEAAVEARVWPLWTAPPAEAPGAARVVDLAGNPDAAALGVVEWALGEGRFTNHFTAHREKDGEAVKVERYLALPRTDRQGKVAVVETADRGRLRVSAPLAAAAESRLATWEALRARAALPEAELAAVPAAELAERDRAHQAELTGLRADYESRLAAADRHTRTDLAQQVRRRLMALALRQRPDTEPRSGEVPS